MVNLLADRVLETSTTTGNGALTLAGTITGYRTFNDAFSNSDIVEYAIIAVNNDGQPAGDWEIGYGAFTSPDTLARATVRASSNSGALVDFGSGTKYVYSNAASGLLELLSYQSGKYLDLSTMTTHNGFYGLRNDTTAGGAAAELVDNSSFKSVGTKEYPLPYNAWHIGGITDPAGTGSTPETNYGLERWSFSNAGTRYLEAMIKLPQSWDAGTITIAPVATANTTSAAQWKFFYQARAFGSEDNSDGAWGTAQSVVMNKTGSRDAYELVIGSATAAITPANTPAKGDWLNIRMYRDPSDGDDTFAATVYFPGATLYYTDDAQTDA